jgi:TatD DNase family protein
MNLPQPDDYINIHTHDAQSCEGIFAVENIMAHENLLPEDLPAKVFTAGIHPWFLNEENSDHLLGYLRNISGHPSLIALGEAGFDKLKGPSIELQRSVFSEQVRMADENRKPLVIHCVKSWDELLSAHKNLKPKTPWLVHGFRGKKELASQLLNRGMFLSIWYDFVLRPESKEILLFIPNERIFLETDGAEVDIKEIYRKVSVDLGLNENELKRIIFNNFLSFFNT